MPEPQHNSTVRRLLAIMFTDLVGYTDLMGRDQQKAIDLLRKNRELQKPLIEKHGGKLIKEMGDGLMASFPTASEAILCAHEVQQKAWTDDDLNLRIGIHLGEVVMEGEDVYGDGVNIASRLQTIADPGGIYISDSIHKAIRGMDITSKYLGELELKNVDYPVKTYAVQGEGLPIPESREDKKLSGTFWAELQRRGVIRAGTTYILLSIILILLLPYVNSLVSFPAWAGTALIIVLVIGFPLALYLAWNYERSPEGFVHTTSRQSWQNPYSASQRKPLTGTYINVGLAVITVVLLFYSKNTSIQESKSITPSETAPTVAEKSIAVLPFADLSPNKDQEYFSVGMMEEILNQLVKIEDLKVTSRTSVMQYQNTTKSIKEIAWELGVATILEGSVRKAGDRVRISVQLINGNTDNHLWSETYERQFRDIFAIQSDVAQKVAGVLKADIYPEVKARIETQPTANLDAYNLWLEGRYAYYENLDTEYSMKLFQRAIELDPNLAPAYASLGAIWLNRGGFARGIESRLYNREEIIRNASYYFEEALKADKDYPNTHLPLGNLHLWYHWDFSAAEREFEIYMKLKPGSPTQDITDFLNSAGRFDEAIEISEEIIETDRNSTSGWSSTGLCYYLAEQLDKGDNHYETALKLFPDPYESWIIYIAAGRVFIYSGRYQRSIEVLNSFLETFPDLRIPRVLSSLAIAYFHTGESERTRELVNELKEQSRKSPAGSPAFYSAMVYAQMEEADKAFEWLEKAYDDHEVEMYWLKVEPPFEPLHDDPRWQEILDKVGFPEFPGE